MAAARKQNEAWAQGSIPGLPVRPAPAPASSSAPISDSGGVFVPISEKKNNTTHVPAAPASPPSKHQPVEKETTTTTTNWKHVTARFRPVASPGGQDSPLYGGITGGGISEDTRAYPATTSSSLGGGDKARVRMPTVPRTRRVADRAIRAARRKISFTSRGRKSGY